MRARQTGLQRAFLSLNRSWCALAFGMIGAFFCAHAALASGYIPMPELRSTLPSYKACVAHLHETAAEHRKQVKPKTFEAGGDFQQIYLEDRTDGVKVTSRKTAAYEARIWYHNGRLSDDGTHYEISHSWNEAKLECKGKTLIANRAAGYTLSTFEPVPAKER